MSNETGLPVYSPLCDTDPTLYLAYLVAVAGHGAGFVGFDAEYRRAALGASGDSCGDVVSRVVGDARDQLARGAAKLALLGTAGLVHRVDGVAHSGNRDAAVGGQGGDVGTSGGIVGCGGGGVGDHCRDSDPSVSGQPPCVPVAPAVVVGTSGGTGQTGVRRSGSLTGQLKRGPNFERNQASRERKKQAKLAKSRAAAQGVDGGRKGFFSSCDEGLQKELRESRARMLILENKRKAVQYAREVARMESPAQLALDVVDLLRKTRDDSKTGADPRVMGWAKTVVSAEVESLAKSAPNSVPSLDSVVLSESNDSRATEYKRRYEELVLIYDSADYYDPSDRADEFNMLRAEFADVVKGDVEAANRFKFARELRVAIAEAAVNGEYACSRAVEAYLDAAENIADD